MDINIHIEKKTIIDFLKNLLLNAVGSSLLAFGVCAFIEPWGFIVGGATGISLVIHRLFAFRISTVSLIINMAVLIPGWFFGGKKLVAGSLMSSLIYPAALAVFETIPDIGSFADNQILACVCGGVVCGSGIALVMRSGGSTGGVDIPELILSKYTHWPIDKIMYTVDTIIMVCQIPISGITNVIYGVIYTWIMTRSLNTVLTFGSDRLKITVISESWEEIVYQLTGANYGATLIHAEGGYTHTPLKKIESIMPRDRYRMAMRIIENIDPTAFITIEKVNDVRGRGYTQEREYIIMEDRDRDRAQNQD